MLVGPTPWISPPNCGAARWWASLPATELHRLCARSGLFAALLCGLVATVWVMPGVSAAAGSDAVLAGRVTRVIDGDTLDVLLSSGRIRVRLQGIDAPERDQAGGTASTQWLTERVLNQDVLLEPVSQDRYDRLLAVVYLEDRNLNRELVSAGQAWAYRRYLRRNDRDMCDLESRAREQRLGLWSAPVARAPWEFRTTLGKGPFTEFNRSTSADCRKATRRR